MTYSCKTQGNRWSLMLLPYTQTALSTTDSTSAVTLSLSASSPSNSNITSNAVCTDVNVPSPSAINIRSNVDAIGDNDKTPLSVAKSSTSSSDIPPENIRKHLFIPMLKFLELFQQSKRYACFSHT